MFLGVYDRWEGAFANTALDVEADYVSWEKSQELNAVITRIRSHSRVPVITIEPFTTKSGEPEKVLQEIVSGANDAIIVANARAIKAHAPQLVLVRFAHEMELVGNYPWSQSSPELFILAYRYYNNFFRKEGVENVRWIWSPAGNINARPYYPGDEYVDYVGVSILGFEDWDLKFGNPTGRPFRSLWEEKVWLAEFAKPIIITELGVSPSVNHNATSWLKYQEDWLQLAQESWFSSPSPLVGVVYFNAVNAENAWQGERPDWRIPANFLPSVEEMPMKTTE